MRLWRSNASDEGRGGVLAGLSQPCPVSAAKKARSFASLVGTKNFPMILCQAQVKCRSGL